MKKTFCLGCTLIVIVGAGCQRAPRCGDLDALSEDVNGNGFLDIAPPEGIEFDPDSTVKVRAGNTLVATDLLPHVAETNVDPAIANLLVNVSDFIVKFSFDLDYGNGLTQRICQTKPLGSFDLAFEAVCPEDVNLDVELIAVLPIVGGIPLTTIPIGLTVDAVDYECGQTISLMTTKNEDGEVV